MNGFRLFCLVQGSSVRLLATASSAADARMKLEALEAGVGGILLRTDEPLQVCCQALEIFALDMPLYAKSGKRQHMKLEALEAVIGGILLRIDDPMQARLALTPWKKMSIHHCLHSCKSREAGGLRGHRRRPPAAH